MPPSNPTVCRKCKRSVMQAMYLHLNEGTKVKESDGKVIPNQLWPSIGKVCRECGAVKVNPEHAKTQIERHKGSQDNCPKCNVNPMQTTYIRASIPKVDKDGHPVMKTDKRGHTAQASAQIWVKAGDICRHCGYWLPASTLLRNAKPAE